MGVFNTCCTNSMLAIYYRLYYRRAGWDLARSRVFSQMLANVYGRLSAAGPSAAGPSAAGPSAAGPSAAGPSAAGPSAAGPSATIEHSSIYIYSMWPRFARQKYIF